MKKKFSRKALKQMEQAARREEWIDLVRLERIAEFAAWLTDDFHAWQGQSPDASECACERTKTDELSSSDTTASIRDARGRSWLYGIRSSASQGRIEEVQDEISCRL